MLDRFIRVPGELMGLLGLLGLAILGALLVIGLDLHRAKTHAPRWVRRLGAFYTMLVAVLGAYAVTTDSIRDHLDILMGLVGALLGSLGLVGAMCFAKGWRRAACVLFVIVLAAVGAFLLAGYTADFYDEPRLRDRLDIVQGQLTELKRRLQQFRDETGRYPTGDEGLSALRGFAPRFPVRLYKRSGGDAAQLPTPYVSMDRRSERRSLFGRSSRRRLSQYREQNGRLPASEGEMRQALGLRKRSPPVPFYEAFDAELAINENHDILLLGPTGAMSPWWLPYVYENRRGLPPEVFAGSPVERDSARRYSVDVDEGICVWSVGGQLCADELDRRWWGDLSIRAFGGALVAAALALVVWICWDREWTPIGISAIVVSLAGGGGFGSFDFMYGNPTDLFIHRDPKMVLRRKELLEKHRAVGVLSEKTYRKTLAAIDLLTATKPASAPALGDDDAPVED